jgi:hypothetical protein
MRSITDCLLCGEKVTGLDHEGSANITCTKEYYYCKRCSYVYLTGTAASIVESFSNDDRHILSMTFRNEWERSGREISMKNLKSSDDLKRIVAQFTSLDPIEKMDNALINCHRVIPYIGKIITIDFNYDYPYYYCENESELISLFGLLQEEGFIKGPDIRNPHVDPKLTAKGYQRIREIQKPNQESNQCFVAMWFAAEMNDAFDKAIMPAIEYVEPGKTKSKFKAIKIDNVEHVNDINDEIIAQIRRSRFMVCDLTGYRGGVYFEAGFAHGLGLDVIYTCRKDWTKAEILKDDEGNDMEFLIDGNGNKIKVQKEGVHFDLAHRNRIEWDPNKLEEFKTKLENRIKAVIY